MASEKTLSVAGKIRTIPEALEVMCTYPYKTPMAFDFVGSGEPGQLTVDEVMRTRKVSSRMSHKEAAYFVEAASTAPWIDADADLADADPREEGLFNDMSALYWHFAERAPKGVSIAKISKVLYLKYPQLYPILDTHLMKAYAPAVKALENELPDLGRRRKVWVAVRADLLQARASGALKQLRTDLQGFEAEDDQEQSRVQAMNGLSDLRLLDILVW